MALPPSLTVQVVLYHTALDQIWRQLRGLIRSAERAKAEGSLDAVHVAYGDSAAAPNLAADTLDDLRRFGEQGGLASVTYDFFDANLGSGGGSNRLAEGRDTPLFLVLNPDTYPDPCLLHALAHHLTLPDIGAADARQLPCEHPKAYEAGTWNTSWVSGAAMMVRRRAFEEVGGFAAEHFPMYCDDVDLSWRLRLAGWRTVHVPHALVFHDKKPAASGVVPQPTEQYWASLARLLLCRRWGRPDLEAETIGFLERFDSGPYQRALAEYRSRETAGTLPEPIPGAGQVACFVNGNYAIHRF